MKFSPLGDQSGISLVEIMVCVVILGALSFAVASYSILNRSNLIAAKQLDGGLRVAVNVAEGLRTTPFKDLFAKCQALNAVNRNRGDNNLDCFVANSPRLTTRTTSIDQYPLGIRLSAAAVPSPSGDFCAEIRSCKLFADGRFLDITLLVSWNDRGRETGVRQSSHIIRVSR